MSFTEFPKESVGSVYPLFASAAGQAFNRVEPLITPDIVVADFLFGIRLKDPVTKQEITVPGIQRAIIRAINAIELALNINVTPLERSIKIPFDKSLFRSFGHAELPFKPITQLNSFTIESSDGVQQFPFPASWIETSNLHLGQINFGNIALQTPVGAVNSYAGSAGIGSSPLVLTTYLNLGWIPQFYRVTFVTGFPENQVPVFINELIGVQTALDILSRMGPIFRTSGTSLSQDGISQSISGPGSNLYKQRLDELGARKAELISQIRSYFYASIFVSNV